MADVSIEEAANQHWDLIALPGGMPGKLASDGGRYDPTNAENAYNMIGS